MKVFIGLIVLIALIGGYLLWFCPCDEPYVAQEPTFSTIVLEHAEIEKKGTDVRLSRYGFDQDSVEISKGESVIVHMITPQPTCKYLSTQGHRSWEKEVGSRERIPFYFEEAGVYEITDENSQYSLSVTVN